MRSGARVDLESIMGSSPPERTTSTGTMTRIVKELPTMIPSTMELTRTRASKKIFLQAFILITTFASLSLFASQTVVQSYNCVSMYNCKVYFR